MNENKLPTIEGNFYDYRAAMYEDIKNAIIYDLGGLDEAERDMDSCYAEVEEYLRDELWAWDSVTGNGSGSYWFSTYKAQCALVGNLDLLGEAIEDFDADASKLCLDPESADVTIRCYLLGQIIYDVVSDLREEADEEEDEDEIERRIQDELSEIAKHTTSTEETA